MTNVVEFLHLEADLGFERKPEIQWIHQYLGASTQWPWVLSYWLPKSTRNKMIGTHDVIDWLAARGKDSRLGCRFESTKKKKGWLHAGIIHYFVEFQDEDDAVLFKLRFL